MKETMADGVRITRFASKKAAHVAGMAARRQGRDVFVYAQADAIRFGLI